MEARGVEQQSHGPYRAKGPKDGHDGPDQEAGLEAVAGSRDGFGRHGVGGRAGRQTPGAEAWGVRMPRLKALAYLEARATTKKQRQRRRERISSVACVDPVSLSKLYTERRREAGLIYNQTLSLVSTSSNAGEVLYLVDAQSAGIGRRATRWAA